jgi:hypothetical protein
MTIRDGKLVNFVTISSICLLTHSIKNCGNQLIKVFFNFITSLNSQLAKALTFISAINDTSTLSPCSVQSHNSTNGCVSSMLFVHLPISAKVSTNHDIAFSDQVCL